MARGFDADDKIRFLKGFSHLIHRKRPVVEALTECMDMEGRGGKHRQFRAAQQCLEQEGPAAALVAAEVISPELASVLGVLFDDGDHRLISDCLTALVRHMEQS